MGNWGEPFIGSEALAAGTVNWRQLRTRCCSLFPDILLDDEVLFWTAVR
jgi:hypothetical protein